MCCRGGQEGAEGMKWDAIPGGVECFRFYVECKRTGVFRYPAGMVCVGV